MSEKKLPLWLRLYPFAVVSVHLHPDPDPDRILVQHDEAEYSLAGIHAGMVRCAVPRSAGRSWRPGIR